MKNARPVTGQAIGEAGDMIRDARLAHQRAANAQSLAEWDPNADFASNPANQAKRLAQTFYQKGTPQYDALKNIYNATGGTGQTAYNVMHMIDPALEYLGASMAGGPGALAAGVAGHAVKPGVGQLLGWFANQKLQRAIQEGYPALTGARTAVTPSTGELLRRLTLGNVAGSQ